MADALSGAPAADRAGPAPKRPAKPQNRMCQEWPTPASFSLLPLGPPTTRGGFFYACDVAQLARAHSDPRHARVFYGPKRKAGTNDDDARWGVMKCKFGYAKELRLHARLRPTWSAGADGLDGGWGKVERLDVPCSHGIGMDWPLVGPSASPFRRASLLRRRFFPGGAAPEVPERRPPEGHPQPGRAFFQRSRRGWGADFGVGGGWRGVARGGHGGSGGRRPTPVGDPASGGPSRGAGAPPGPVG